MEEIFQLLEILILPLPTRKLCIHFIYKNCTRCIQLIYTKFIQNVYHILTSFCIHFVYKIKRIMPAKCCIQNVYKSLLKCGIHFVYILYTKCIQEFVEIPMGYILYRNILCTFCIHQFWSTKSVHHRHYVYNLYTKFIQNVYTNNCKQNGSLISTYFDLSVVHF